MFELVIATALAIVVSAACSIFEAVLYAMPDSYIELMRNQGKKSGNTLKELRRQMERPITAILSLNTIANTMGAAIAGAAATRVMGSNTLFLFSAAFTMAILIFSEILPKTIGVSYYRALGPLIATPVMGLIRILSPLVWLCEKFTRLIPATGTDQIVSEEEVRALAALSRRTGEIGPQEERVIANVLELDERRVVEVMTPRTVTFLLNEKLTVAEAVADKEKWKRHSRVPIYGRDNDDISGMVFRKDVLLAAAEGLGKVRLRTLMHPVHFVPETAPLAGVLQEFIVKRNHLFVVVDEYGGFTGVISLEDIIEEIVGREIMDESDKIRDLRALARRLGRKNSRNDDSASR